MTPLDIIDAMQSAYIAKMGAAIPVGEFCTDETLERAAIQARLAIAGGRGPLHADEFPSPLEDLPWVE